MRAICRRADVVLPQSSCHFSVPEVVGFNGWAMVPLTVVAKSSKASRIDWPTLVVVAGALLERR